MVDIFGALIFLKTAKVVHADLKPENIMMVNDTNYHVVLCDFGLSKIINDDKPITDFNVQTCWYRSPEVALHIPYSYEADLWSVGVILIELIIEYPLFRAKDDASLYYLFNQMLGKPPKAMIPNNPTIKNGTLMADIQEKLDIHLKKVVALMNQNILLEIEPIIDGIMVWEPSKRYNLETCLSLTMSINT
jgi:serine/threonine protein kinase